MIRMTRNTSFVHRGTIFSWRSSRCRTDGNDRTGCGSSFPQIEGLGSSAMSRRYAIKNQAEARAYLEHAVLGPVCWLVPRLCLNSRVGRRSKSSDSLDDRKLRSCATLFAEVSPSGSVFHRLLEKYFQGKHNVATLDGWLRGGRGLNDGYVFARSGKDLAGNRSLTRTPSAK